MIQYFEEKNRTVVYNTKNGRSADIVKFEDYCMGSVKTKFRIDVGGITKESMIASKSAAKNKSKKYVL